MNIKIKIGAIITGTLLLGIILGGLIHSAVMKQRIKQIRSFRDRGGFETFLERIIQPDESQRLKIQAVFDKYNPKIYEIRRQHFKEFSALIDSLKAELDPILTPEQREKLKRPPMRMRPGSFPGHPPRDRHDSLTFPKMNNR